MSIYLGCILWNFHLEYTYKLSINYPEPYEKRTLSETKGTWNPDVTLSYKEDHDKKCVQTESYELVGSCFGFYSISGCVKSSLDLLL